MPLKLVALLALVGMASQAIAETYEVRVTRKESNLYKIDGKDIFVVTKYCYEYGYSEEAVLRMSGRTGKLIFLDNEKTYEVTGAFEKLEPKAGKNLVTVSQEGDDWYQVDGTEGFIRTDGCINLALGEEVLLNMPGYGDGKLHFLDDDSSCRVEGVYERLRL